MTDDDSVSPRSDIPWLVEQRANVLRYLEAEGVQHGGLPCAPAWFLAPILAVWTVRLLKAPGAIGWWAISGDVPTDYLSGREAHDARGAVAAFARRWREVSEYLIRGEEHPTVKFRDVENREGLGELLRTRADLLERWAEDEEIWE